MTMASQSIMDDPLKIEDKALTVANLEAHLHHHAVSQPLQTRSGSDPGKVECPAADLRCQQARQLPSEIVFLILSLLCRHNPQTASLVALVCREAHRMCTADKWCGWRQVIMVGPDLDSLSRAAQLYEGDEIVTAIFLTNYSENTYPDVSVWHKEQHSAQELWSLLIASLPRLEVIHVWQPLNSKLSDLLVAEPLYNSHTSRTVSSVSFVHSSEVTSGRAGANALAHGAASVNVLYPRVSDLHELPHKGNVWHLMRWTRPIECRDYLELGHFFVGLALSTFQFARESNIEPTSFPLRVLIIELGEEDATYEDLKRMAWAVENAAHRLREISSPPLPCLCRVHFIHPALGNSRDDWGDDWVPHRGWSKKHCLKQCIRTVCGQPSWWSMSDWDQVRLPMDIINEGDRSTRYPLQNVVHSDVLAGTVKPAIDGPTEVTSSDDAHREVSIPDDALGEVSISDDALGEVSSTDGALHEGDVDYMDGEDSSSAGSGPSEELHVASQVDPDSDLLTDVRQIDWSW